MSRIDVCLILEGSYPYVVGGVSSWTHSLVSSLADLRFHVLSIQPFDNTEKPQYPPLDNIVGSSVLGIGGRKPVVRVDKRQDIEILLDAFQAFIANGDRAAFAIVEASLTTSEELRGGRELTEYEIASALYQRLVPDSSFHQFFWMWQLFAGCLQDVVNFKIPEAKVYHTISTGYAGLLGACAKKEYGAPLLLTEHGIYTHERIVDLLGSTQFFNSFGGDSRFIEPRLDVRDVWLRGFSSMAKICYDECAMITSLSSVGQSAQLQLGADPQKLRTIANGIDVAKFSKIERKKPNDKFVGVLVGRVVSVKDIETFVRAANILKNRKMDFEFWVVGPESEEITYSENCKALVQELELQNHVIFMGTQNIPEVLAKVDCLILTSVTEGQPLTILEAGAAGVPCIATDVGACREMLLGAEDENPNFGAGGIVTELMSADSTADAVERLIKNKKKAEAMGKSLKARVTSRYSVEKMVQSYRNVYQTVLDAR